VSGSTRAATFQDLGSGLIYGSLQFSSAVLGTTVTVDLNDAALADLNLAGDLWAFGGAVTSRDSGAECLFHGSGIRSMPRLLITIPEPTAMVLAVSALLLRPFRSRAFGISSE
jgi:hypothetical protein